MMNQTYYDYQIKPIIKTMKESNGMALITVVTNSPGCDNPHASTWLSVSAEQLKAILKILNTTI
jgi:hypothetical protein